MITCTPPKCPCTKIPCPGCNRLFRMRKCKASAIISNSHKSNTEAARPLEVTAIVYNSNCDQHLLPTAARMEGSLAACYPEVSHFNSAPDSSSFTGSDGQRFTPVGATRSRVPKKHLPLHAPAAAARRIVANRPAYSKI